MSTDQTAMNSEHAAPGANWLDRLDSLLVAAGWTCDGKAPPRYHICRGRTVRIPPTGRIRYRKGSRRATVGKRTTCFYNVINGAACDFHTIPTPEVDQQAISNPANGGFAEHTA